MGAEDPTRLGGGNLIPGSEPDGTLQDLANQAEMLSSTLDAFAAVLANSHPGRFAVVPAIYREIQRFTDPVQASQAIRTLVASYRKHLSWMHKVLRVEPRSVSALTTEAMSRERLTNHPISQNSNMPNVPPEQVALSLFHWVAEWIRDYRETMPTDLVSGNPGEVNGGYWPPLSGDGIAVLADRAGDLTPVPHQNIEVTLRWLLRHRACVAERLAGPDCRRRPLSFRDSARRPDGIAAVGDAPSGSGHRPPDVDRNPRSR